MQNFRLSDIFLKPYAPTHTYGCQCTWKHLLKPAVHPLTPACTRKHPLAPAASIMNKKCQKRIKEWALEQKSNILVQMIFKIYSFQSQLIWCEYTFTLAITTQQSVNTRLHPQLL